MKKLIILFILSSCGKEPEFEVNSSMCIDKCIEINLTKNNNNQNDSYQYCTEKVIPEVKCFTQDNESFYYR